MNQPLQPQLLKLEVLLKMLLKLVVQEQQFQIS